MTEPPPDAPAPGGGAPRERADSDAARAEGSGAGRTGAGRTGAVGPDAGGGPEALAPPAPFRVSSRPSSRSPAPPRRPLGSPGPADPRPERPRRWDRVGVRLAALLALALLPLGLVGLATAAAWREAAQDRASAALLGETLGAAAPAIALIREAQGSAAALAATLGPVLDDEAACVAAMTAVVRRAPQYSIAAFVPASGMMTCGSDGARFDYSGTPLFLRMRDEGFPAKVYVQARGPVSGVSVVLAAQPVAGFDGAVRGYVGLALPHAALQAADATATAGASALPAPDFVTFNGDGAVLTTSRGFGAEAGLLPGGVDLAALAREEPGTFRGRTAAGEERTFAVAPVVPGALYALGSRPAREVLALGPLATAAPFLTVAAMWAATLAVAGWASHRLVARHMRRLAQGIADFAARGRIDEGLALARAPGEVREVAAAFLRMAGKILRDEADLEDGLRQREALLREVHHRTRNNLQLMASIISMQVRRARSEEAKALMRGLQERVLSLAAVHRELYATAGVAEIAADELLRDIARQVVGARGPRSWEAAALETRLAPLRLGPDLAVPLALFLTEAATALLSAGAQQVRVTLTVEEGAEGGTAGAAPGGADRGPEGAEARATLAVEGGGQRAAPTSALPEGHAELGAQLLAALAQQLGGRLDRDPSGLRAAVTFPAGRVGG